MPTALRYAQKPQLPANGRGKPRPYVTTNNRTAQKDVKNTVFPLGNTVFSHFYFPKYRYRNVMIWALVQGESGLNVVLLVPVVMPLLYAQAMAAS